MRLEPFSPSEREDRRSQAGKARLGHTLNRHHAHKVRRAQASTKSGGAPGRQHVIGARSVIACRLRGVRSDEYGACDEPSTDERFSMQHQMLRGDSVREGNSLPGVPRHDHGTACRQRGRGRAPIG